MLSNICGNGRKSQTDLQRAALSGEGLQDACCVAPGDLVAETPFSESSCKIRTFRAVSVRFLWTQTQRTLFWHGWSRCPKYLSGATFSRRDRRRLKSPATANENRLKPVVARAHLSGFSCQAAGLRFFETLGQLQVAFSLSTSSRATSYPAILRARAKEPIGLHDCTFPTFFIRQRICCGPATQPKVPSGSGSNGFTVPKHVGVSSGPPRQEHGAGVPAPHTDSA